MPNIAALLKAEITRLAAKTVRQETESLKRSSAAYRSEIAALKRRVSSLEQQVKRLGKAPAARTHNPTEGDPGPALRFSAAGLAKQRQRLGLSAAACGLLLGVSALSVYKWESGKTRPRAKQLPAIAALRAMGKREAHARLQEQGF
jgi:DNA-binding transcriptional regulator YiaG